MLSETRSVELAHGELGRVLGGIEGGPLLTRLFRHPKAIPQYVLGHPARLASIERERARHPGLHLAGNAYTGIGVNDCVRDARALAARIVAEAVPEETMPLAAGGRP
jgi:oxygen-dependent protoporphyrinogen oxidase